MPAAVAFANLMPHGGGGDRAMRHPNRQEHLPHHLLARTTSSEIGSDGASYRRQERQLDQRSGLLPTNPQELRGPVDVVEPKSSNLARPHAVTGKQQQHPPVPG